MQSNKLEILTNIISNPYLVSQNLIHSIDCSGMSPVTIMDGSKSNTLFLALHSCIHQMSGIQAVNEIGREGRLLLIFINRKLKY